MKKIVFVLIMSSFSLLSQAQVQRTTKPVVGPDSTAIGNPIANTGKGGKRKALKELNLSKEQRSKIKEIRQSEKVKEDQIANDNSLTEEQKNAKLRDMKMQQAQNMRSVLNDEQKEKMKKLRMEMRQNRQKKNNN